MLRKIALLPIVMLFCALGLGAQDLTIVDFQSTMNPMTVEMQRRDFNNDICALVKVQLPVSGVTFEGNTVGDALFKTNEYWVYLTPGTKFLQVKCPGHYPLYIDFRDLGIESLVGKHIYVLRLKAAVVPTGPQQTDAGANYLVLDVTPKTGLSVRVDGQTQPVEDGMVRVYLKYGTHSYRIEADGYAPAEGNVEITSAGKTTKQVQLESVMAMLLVKPETPESSIFINDAMKGTGTWSGQLNPGLYRIEARKQGYQSRIENVELFQRDNKTLTIPALTPIYGMINVDYKPIGSKVEIDGRELGTTPDMFNNVLVGQHTVTVSKPGYQTHTETVTVREGEESRISGSLTAEARQQPATQQTYTAPAQTQTQSSYSQPVTYSGGIPQSTNGGATIKKESNGDLSITCNGITFKMVYVEGGTFMMGDDEHGTTHQPHSVTLDSYYMFPGEMTQFMWESFMGSNPSSNKQGGGYPVESVSYDDIQQFIAKLNAKAGLNFRLPTEAEWEYAARGGKKSRNYRYSGSNNLDEVSWHGGNSGNKSHQCRQKKPNELGLYDMSGNLEEICSDWYDDNYYSNSPQYNPENTTRDSNNRHVNRGGRFSQDETLIVFHKPTRRFYENLQSGSWTTGFRIVLPAGSSNRSSAPTSSYSQPTSSAQPRAFTVNGYTFEMIPVAGGSFSMGSSKFGTAHKPHQVSVSDYYIGKYEVTEGLWNAVMGSSTSSKGQTYPAGNVSYSKALQFTQKLSTLTGKKFRLPTEAEWEYAARGGELSQNYTYPGTNVLSELGLGKDVQKGLNPVGKYKPNELGIYDMAGNAYEWCSDWYSDDYYSNSVANNPKGPSSGKERVKRGGYYNSADVFYESTRRFYGEASQDYFFNGLRVVMEADGRIAHTTASALAPVTYSQPTSSAQPRAFTVNGYTFEMIPVDGGTFSMKSQSRTVNLADFMIGKYEVTEGLWNAVMGTPSTSKGANYPVGNISYAKAEQFVRRLNQLTGQNFRIPTEEEWEYAACGGRMSQNYTYPGTNVLSELGLGKDMQKGLNPVGKYKPNELGIYDMAGNAYEWVDGWNSKRTERAKRGGYYNSTEVFYQTNRAFHAEPDQAYFFNGFRIALSGNGGSSNYTSTTSFASTSSNALTFNANGVSFEIIPVTGGTFTMGSTDHGSAHKPHNVSLSSYGIGKFEVTQDLWQAVMGSNPSYTKGSRLPVVGVKYAECVTFCRKLSQITGRTFRLPTEAEWEYAARGGQNSQMNKYSGSNNLDDVAWHKGNSGSKPHPVGQKKPNELGIYDMSGNAQEWCHDWYDESYYASSPVNNPKGPSGPDNDKGRVVRGAHNSDDMEVFFKPVRRYREKPESGSMDTGFRVAMDM
ncbi:MAG: SUMF1/EgtB/PvdO family nonheme iron enzyme [Muribaculum sp.]|nr:SUMF1/EgtB/PvdO family nonheme iron enzyme [Muribaculaceae bacterium]MCM1081800.1 SUMF1/EgtB/PvdO family nonheme iron enzyme [Muribaculum sp.]